jgi:hypothetical protein
VAAKEVLRVLGLAQVRKNLESLSDALQKDIVKAGERAAIKVFAAAVARTTYSADRQQRTGLLLASQRISVRRRGDVIGAKLYMGKVGYTGTFAARHLVAGTRRRKTSGEDVKKTTGFYWWFLERGTKQRRTKRGANRGALAARAWVGPAFEARGDEAIEAFSKTVATMVDQACAQLPPSVPNRGVTS